MTDFSPLLVADRGQKAHPIHLVDKSELRGLGENPPGGGPRLDQGSPLRREDRASPSSILPRKGDEFEVVSAVADARSFRPGASPSSVRACPKEPTSLRRASPVRPRSAGCSPSIASTPIARRRTKRTRTARAGHRRTGEDRCRPSAWPRRSALVRDLVNTPAGDLGPAELEQAVRKQAERHRRRGPGHVRQGSRRRLSADRRGRTGRLERNARRGLSSSSGAIRTTRASRSSARVSASTAAGSTSSPRAACG